MALKCPKCGKILPDDAVYCLYCGHGIQPYARTSQVSAGGILIIVAAVTSLIIFIQSLRALITIYNWYPLAVAQAWAPYDLLVAIFTFTGLMFGLSAGILTLARRSYVWTMVSATLCTLSGAATWITSMIAPGSNVQSSLIYFFLPLFVPALIGTALIFPRNPEFKQ